MDTYTAILSRRSIRKFKQEKVSDELIDKLLEAGYNAPSACNRKPFIMYVIENQEKLELLNKSGRFTNMPSPLIILVCGDLNKALPKGFKDYWIQDCSAVTQNILIMAQALGLGTCWNGVHPQELVVKKIKEILNLEENIIPLSLIHIGYPDEIKEMNKGYKKDSVIIIK